MFEWTDHFVQFNEISTSVDGGRRLARDRENYKKASPYTETT
jgi:hypothetical protein